MSTILPYELIDYISNFVDAKVLCKLRSTCKKYRDVGIIQYGTEEFINLVKELSYKL